MAAVLVTTIKRFLGTAAEMAALNVAKVPAGSTFFQTDTGLLYNLDSAGFWAVKKTQLAALPAGTAVIGKVSIDQTIPGTTNKVVAELSGSIPEYGWIDGDTEPTPTGFAFGAKVDSTTGNITCMYWNGTAWVEVE